MRINDYLSEIEFAGNNVIATIWAEHERIDELRAEIKGLSLTVADTYQRAATLQDSDDLDDVMMGAGVYWENYFDGDKRLFHKNEEEQKLADQIDLHEFSRASLSG